MNKFERYGLLWDEGLEPLRLEMYMVQKGGQWTEGGQTFGLGLEYHMERMRQIIWPELDSHRWHTLCLQEQARNKVTVFMGPGSSGKTHEGAWFYLCLYWCDPQNTCVLVSSTDMRGLRMRAWGEMSSLWQKGKDRFPWLAGHLLDSRVAITTDSLMDGAFEKRTVRDMRKGIVGIPTVQGGKKIGLGKWVGIKQKNVYLLADEAQQMGEAFLSAFANLNKNENFRATVCGNPEDALDPLGKAAEPLDGWEDHLQPEKTEVWKTRFMNGTCVNLVGMDSPNFDFPEHEPTRYKYLISREKIADTLSFFPKDSVEFYSQCWGIMKIGTMQHRVMTRDQARQWEVKKLPIWKTGPAYKICALDAAYGGDRCIIGHADVGEDPDGLWIIAFHEPEEVPIVISSDVTPEDQIAIYCRQYNEKYNIPPENFFHDSTGRGSLGTALARAWSDRCSPVEFGGDPTDRIVSLDTYVYDNAKKVRRHKTCKEAYKKFVTELWFSLRYAGEAKQIRNMPHEAIDDFASRDWRPTPDNRKELETKLEMKLRVKLSPDHGDWASIIIEGARRKGFNVAKLANATQKAEGLLWLAERRIKIDKVMQSKRLNYAKN